MSVRPWNGALQIYVISSLAYFLQAQIPFPSSTNISTSWTNDPSIVDYNSIILFNAKPASVYGFGFACGFYSHEREADAFYFAIGYAEILIDFTSGKQSGSFEYVIWLANRNQPVGKNATVELLAEGDLVLKDADGTLVWSTNTYDKSVVGMKMMETGNLVLHDVNNNTIWQSFDYPTDTLVLEQALVLGKSLVASISESNVSEGNYFLNLTTEGLESSYIRLNLDHDGHLRFYDNTSNAYDILGNYLNGCDYPTSYGNYGLCSNGSCSCPLGFDKDNGSSGQAEFGCSRTIRITCENPLSYSLLSYENFYYLGYEGVILNKTDKESCKEACLKNCSCGAALFRSYDSLFVGDCLSPSPHLSLIDGRKERSDHRSYAFIKISDDGGTGKGSNASTNTGKGSPASAFHTDIIAGSTIAAFFLVCVVVGSFWIIHRKRREMEDETEDYLDELSGMPTRFTYKELNVATKDFQKRLGGGGFGSVFQGSLPNGEKIAVKRLNALGQGKKEFLAEVKTIGSIHHNNLVRVIGFCAEKLYRLLVYEFMCNGSLDKWIFFKQPSQPPLNWQARRSIIQGIAKGLAYLHEDCRQRIVHLDIKPQNILLDETLCAKISDFGLSKLIDRDQSQVVTTMRGTPGYLAPEWFTSIITEKADVYSFGIVVMEVVCGRKNLDRSQPEELMHLLPVFMKKAEEDQLIDIVDESCEDMLLHKSEAVETMRVAIWCLQSDYTRRPSMSIVVKVLEGAMDVEPELDYKVQNPTSLAILRRETEFKIITTLYPSVLSRPR